VGDVEKNPTIRYENPKLKGGLYQGEMKDKSLVHGKDNKRKKGVEDDFTFITSKEKK